MVIRKSAPLTPTDSGSDIVARSSSLSVAQPHDGHGSGLVAHRPSTGGRVGRFELVRRLGQGGEGTVYEARDQRGGVVALKQLHPQRVASGASLTREFRALADIVHPNLVSLRELFHEDGAWFYTMDLVQGTDFVRYVRPPLQAFHAERLRSALGQLLSGVAVLHHAGKLHRDLKPSNVLVRNDGSVVILDYGLVIDQSESAAPLPGWERIAGTPAYAAPEQATGRAEPASDLYAIGVMLHQALVGRLPDDGQPSDQPRDPEQVWQLRGMLAAAEVPRDLASLCARLLAPDPAARPAVDEALAICSRRMPAFSPPADRAIGRDSFVGRTALLAQLAEATATRDDRPLLVLLSGESGIGKTALLAQFCQARRGAGALVLRGRCYEREQVPYKALDAIIEQLVQHLNALGEGALDLSDRQRGALIRVFPAFARLDAMGDQAAAVGHAVGLRACAFSALRAACATLTARREVVFAIDDLQWGDLDSVELLAHLLAGDDAPPLTVVAVFRTDERTTSPALQAMASALEGVRLSRVELTVGPLAHDEAADLLATLAHEEGALSGIDATDFLAQAGGVPFALQQLVAHARDTAGAVPGNDGLLRDAVRQRAAHCSQEARTLLEILCVAGRPLETLLALRSAEVDFSAALELCARKLARWRDTEHARCLEPYHDLIREALTNTIDVQRARVIHRQIVDQLEVRASECPEYLVEHLQGAGDHERAGLMALAAADRASCQLAWNRTIDLLCIARRLLDDAAIRERGVLGRLADAYAAADRHQDAAAAYAEVARDAEGAPERQRVEALAAQQLMRAGDAPRAIALVRKLLGEAGYRYPRHWALAFISYLTNRLRQRIERAFTSASCDTHERSPESASRIRALAAAYNELWLSEPLRASVIHNWFYREARRARDGSWLRAQVWEIVHLSVRYGAAGEARVARLLREAEAWSCPEPTPHEVALRYLARAVYLMHCRVQPREALDWLDTADELLVRCPGSHFDRGWVALLRVIALELTGGFADVRAAVDARAGSKGIHEDGYSASQLLITLPLAHLLDDRPDAALVYLQTNWKRPRRLTIVDFAVLARISTALLYKGDVVAASASLTREWGALWRSGVLTSRTARESAYYHRARNAAALYFRTGEARLAREVERRVARAEHLPVIYRGLFRLTAASVARAAGRTTACRTLLLDALDHFDQQGAQAPAWCTRYRLAQLDRSPEQLARARAWFSASGVRAPERWVALTIPGDADDWTR